MISIPLYWQSFLKISPRSDLIWFVDDFAPILRREHDVVLAHPLRVRQAVGLLGHTATTALSTRFLAA